MNDSSIMNTSISTGSPKLNQALGGNGIPQGTIVEVFGEPGSGKTTLGLELAASMQAQNGVVMWIDTEHSLNRQYAENVGLETDALLVSQPDSGEEALDIAETCCRSGGVDLVVLDSVAALMTRFERNASLRDSMSKQVHYKRAEMITRSVRTISMYCREVGTNFIMINQTRHSMDENGNQKTDQKTPGGKSMKFYTYARLQLFRKASLVQGGTHRGIKVLVKTIKNRAAQPFKQVYLDILYDRGFCPYGEIIDQALEQDILTKRNRRYVLQNRELADTREELRNRLEGDSDLFRRIENALA